MIVLQCTGLLLAYYGDTSFTCDEGFCILLWMLCKVMHADCLRCYCLAIMVLRKTG
jgi:hypothetical protein